MKILFMEKVMDPKKTYHYTVKNNPPRLNNVLFVYDEETISSENRHKTLTKYYLR